MAKKRAKPKTKNNKGEYARAGLVKPAGSKQDSLHWMCYGCKCIVFWRLLTLCDAGKHLCDWCMAKRGWKRMRGSRPLVCKGVNNG